MSREFKLRLLVAGVALLAIVITGCAAAPSRDASQQAADQAWVEEPYAYEGAAEVEMGAAVPMEAPAAEEQEASGRATGGEVSEINLQNIDPQQQRLIIKNGSIAISVADTVEARDRIEQIVNGMTDEGAFVVNVNESGGGSNTSPYINMSIRVPSARFDEVLDQIAAMAYRGTNPSINVSADDVTSEYVDVEARLESLEAARDRLLELMENAQTTEDLLMAEQQLTQREAEIEALKGRLQYLSEAARLSRIDITLQPYILSQPVDTRWRPAETVRAAVDALLGGMRDFGDFAIYFVIAVLPWLLVAGLVVVAVVKLVQWRARVRRERQSTGAGSAAS